MTELWATLVGIVAGAVGYLLTTFVFQPILGYRAIRSQIVSDLLFYANAIKADGTKDLFSQRVYDRIEANRRHSADLAACYHALPYFYKQYLLRLREDPNNAAAEMMGLSNTFEWEASRERVEAIQKYLRVEPRVIAYSGLRRTPIPI